MLVTALSPIIGYVRAAAIAHKALNEGTTLRKAAITSGAVSAEQFDEIVVPAKMVGLGDPSGGPSQRPREPGL